MIKGFGRRRDVVAGEAANARVDPSLGHEAEAPTAIPPRGWWRVIKRVASESSTER